MADGFIGEIRLFAGNFAPVNWMSCNGQLISIASNTALFSILGTTYGGNGQTTFALPDLRGRVPIGQGQGPGLSNYSLGQVAGVEQMTLLTTQLPSHNHPATKGTLKIAAFSGPGNSRGPGDAVPAKEAAGVTQTYSTDAATGTMAANAFTPTLAAAGAGQPVGIMKPYLTLTYIICVSGIFPSRN